MTEQTSPEQLLARLIAERKPSTSKELEACRREIARSFKLKHLPSNTDVLRVLTDEERVRSLLRIKPTRTASGIAVIAVMAEPHSCPHGVCTYCPGGVNWGTPQSYTGSEPAAMRAKEKNFDPYLQVKGRIDQLRSTGHSVGKCELVMIGGTFTSMSEIYQTNFVKKCLDALNQVDSPSLDQAKQVSEDAHLKNVGITIETRPDHCKQKHIDLMISYGTTRVEIGVQALDDEIYRVVNRGHTVQDVVEAFHSAKDSGMKIVAHLMPGLPGSTPEKDLDAFRILLQDSRFKPDMLKIYPCLVTEGTALYGLFKSGKYEPYDESIAVPLIAEMKKIIPPWVRVMRIQREIPSQKIVAGVKSSNLRQLIFEEVEKRGFSCKCIRCREVGLNHEHSLSESDLQVFREDYDSSEGTEIFLSYEDSRRKTLVGFLRMRIPSKVASRPEMIGNRSCMVRELRVYGSLVPVGKRDNDLWQHKGYGSKLIMEGEKIAREDFDSSKMLVISALGTRGYYRKFDYELDGPYMSKPL